MRKKLMHTGKQSNETLFNELAQLIEKVSDNWYQQPTAPLPCFFGK
jgi:hypothetical protein